MKRITKIFLTMVGVGAVAALVRREKDILSDIRIENLKRRYK